LAAGVLVVAGHEHGRPEEQIAPLVELGEFALQAHSFGLLAELAPTVVPGDRGPALVDPGQMLHQGAVTEILLHDPVADADGLVVVTTAIATGFPGHGSVSKAAHRRRCSTTLHRNLRAHPDRARRMNGGSRWNPIQASAMDGELQVYVRCGRFYAARELSATG
jgi:hypothetical protein